jgi:hypothetical protein
MYLTRTFGGTLKLFDCGVTCGGSLICDTAFSIFIKTYSMTLRYIIKVDVKRFSERTRTGFFWHRKKPSDGVL